MFSYLLRTLLLVTLISSSTFALSGTGGTPLGGMGTGYVIFNGQKFSVSGKMPPAAADHCKGTPEKQISSSGFHLFANGTAKSPATATSEDAKCPLQTADFGTVGGVKFTLDAFGPYWPGEGKEKFQLATSPLAFFDITAENSGTAAAEVAVAMEFANGGLLGGANSGTVEAGNRAISFAGSPDNAYLAVDCDGTTPTLSAGGTGTFSTNGTLSNTDGNLVAAKCTVDAGGKVHFKFVLAWYRTYDSEGYYYHNFYKNSKEAAEFGLSKFDNVRDGITSFVDRLMASNFPEWYKDRLLNNTYPLIHNSVFAKDGRSAFWEGNYGIIGTIDQGQHAAVFYSFNWPSVQWHELQYWARQQKTNGQVHHDFNQGVMKFTPGSSANNRHLLPWDDKTHPDYWWFPNTETWADLNCMFIFKAYELMLATGDLDSLKKSWPALKKSAERLASQCGGGSKLPTDAHSTYDRCTGPGTGCTFTPEYNGGIAITAFSAVSELAKFLEDNTTATTYAGYAKSLKTAFKDKYGKSKDFGVNASLPNSGRFPESHIAGYSWANYLCLNPIMDEDFITTTCAKMRAKQKSGGVRANGEWIFYDVDHYGGSEIAINQPDAAMHIHKQDYDSYYMNNPKEVHWQSLQESSKFTGHDSYMTAPVVWHSYFQFCGYMIDNANKRLWIRPRIPTEMKGEIKNALLLNPKALGTLNYKEFTTGDITQNITIAYDAPVTIKELILKNNTGVSTPFISVGGIPQSGVTVEKLEIENNIRVTLASPLPIGPEGVTITVSKVAVGIATGNQYSAQIKNAILTTSLVKNKPLVFNVNRNGHVSIDILALNGSKIGSLFSGAATAGQHSVAWSGTTSSGQKLVSQSVILRLSTPTGTVSQRVVICE